MTGRKATIAAVGLGFVLSQLAIGAPSLRSWALLVAGVLVAALVGFVFARWWVLSFALTPFVLVALGLFEGSSDSTDAQIASVFVMMNAICIGGGVLAGTVRARPRIPDR